MGDEPDLERQKEKFFFSAYNRIFLNPAKHVHDEHLKFTPAPLSTINPPELILPRTPAFFTGFTQAGGKFRTSKSFFLFNNKIRHVLEFLVIEFCHLTKIGGF